MTSYDYPRSPIIKTSVHVPLPLTLFNKKKYKRKKKKKTKKASQKSISVALIHSNTLHIHKHATVKTRSFFVLLHVIFNCNRLCRFGNRRHLGNQLPTSEVDVMELSFCNFWSDPFYQPRQVCHILSHAKELPDVFGRRRTLRAHGR